MQDEPGSPMRMYLVIFLFVTVLVVGVLVVYDIESEKRCWKMDYYSKSKCMRDLPAFSWLKKL
jgi:hypothetical protein